MRKGVKKNKITKIQNPKNIGLIGIGVLGNAIGCRLLELGYHLTIYSRTKKRTRELEKLGARVVNYPSDVAKNSDIVIIVVRDFKAVNNVSFGNNGIIEGKHKNLIIADMSTISPEESKKISKKFLKNKIIKLDIPVMGGPKVAIIGELIMLVSGNKKTYNNLKKFLKQIAIKTFYLGNSGVANLIKLALNLQITMLALSLAEGITLVKSAKVDPLKFLNVLNATYFKTGMSENKAYKMIKGEFDATFTLKNLKKDIGIIVKTAKLNNVDLEMVNKAEKIYTNAMRQGFGGLDYTGILAYISKKNQK